MRLLSRAEEMVLLTIWKLKDEAYCVPIREHLIALTKKNWSFGSVFNPLERLERKGLLRSSLTGPTKMRGGRSKRVYRLTMDGKKALAELYQIQSTIWDDISVLESEPEKLET